MSKVGNGVATAPEVTLEISSGGKMKGYVRKLQRFAGASIGSCVVAYPANMADNPSFVRGARATVSLDGRPIFTGLVLITHVKADSQDDLLEVILEDDKWLMQSRICGQGGIGDVSATAGFKDVGFEIVFNADGKPNRNGGTFSTGSNAQYWTLYQCLTFVFNNYVPASVAFISNPMIGAYWDKYPSHLSITGQSALQAINTIVEMAGCSWSLSPGGAFKVVQPGYGDQSGVQLFRPYGRATVRSAQDTAVSDLGVSTSIEKCKDAILCHSAPVLKESTYSVANDLLVRVTTFTDKEYTARFKFNVAAYSDNALGQNLSAGSKPKKTTTQLCTRMNTARDGYLTAAQLAADPTLLANEPPEKLPLWVSATGDASDAVLVTGGYRIDHDQGFLDFRAELEVAPQSASTATRALNISDWASAGVWVTLVTVLPSQYETSRSGGLYLLTQMYAVIQKTDLVPERRQNSWLPDLSLGANAVVIAANGAEEKYVDYTETLKDVADAEQSRASTIESSVDVVLPFCPYMDIGDRLTLNNRNLGQQGDEMIVSIEYDIYEAYDMRVAASNITAAVDPQRFIKGLGGGGGGADVQLAGRTQIAGRRQGKLREVSRNVTVAPKEGNRGAGFFLPRIDQQALYVGAGFIYALISGEYYWPGAGDVDYVTAASRADGFYLIGFLISVHPDFGYFTTTYKPSLWIVSAAGWRGQQNAAYVFWPVIWAEAKGDAWISAENIFDGVILCPGYSQPDTGGGLYYAASLLTPDTVAVTAHSPGSGSGTEYNGGTPP